MTQYPAAINLSSLNGSNGFDLSGEQAGDFAGKSVSAAGDINGDGIPDLIIGADNNDANGVNNAGAAYVVFGEVGGFAANLDLSTLNGTNGFKISGETAFELAGWSVSDAGDVNGDGFDDMMVGSPYTAPNGSQSGTSYVVFGHASGFSANFNLSALTPSTGFRINGPATNYLAGDALHSAGDVNGDGFDDVIVGARYASPHGSHSGAAYVVFGKASGFSDLNLGSLTGANGFKISGAVANDYLGVGVSSAGDVNGDGFDDLIVGAYRAAGQVSQSGAAYVVFGKASGFAANVDVTALTGANGFKLSGETANDNVGFSVAAAGDVNGDGFADVVIGAPNADPNANASSGAAYVVFGKAAGFAANINLSTLDGTNGFVVNGVAASDGTGRSVSSAGDLNGDGLADLLIGARGADPHGAGSGASYVVYGLLPDAIVNRTGTDIGQNLVGGNFADQLYGLGGADHLFGHDGNDVLDGGAGNDILDGGVGTADIATYADAPSAVTVSLQITGPQNTVGAGTDTLIGIEAIFGSNFNDQLTASAATADALGGGAGNDLLIGGPANDLFIGGNGVDAVSFQAATAGVTVSLLLAGAQNTIGAGTDQFSSIEKLVGSGFADTLTANPTGATLNGGPGGDDLIGGPGSDILNGGGASDFADYALATAGVTVNLTLTGFQNTVGAGSDELVSIEKVVGSGFNDTITGDAGVNTLFGEGGDDSINGGANGDYLFGNAGNDTLNGGAGQDNLTGGAGNDTFVFSALTDSLTAHPDTILDFAAGDKIDLHLIDANTGVAGDQAFVIGSAGVAGHIVVSAFDVGNNRTAVSLYVDNNPSVDAVIWLTGDHHTLAAGDFML